MPKLILASNSPRRAELLKQIGVDFEQYGVEIDETPQVNENARALVERLALEKARCAQARYFTENGGNSVKRADYFFLGSDTLGALAGSLLLKPENEAHARDMLRTMSDKWHEIYSAVALVGEVSARIVVNRTEVEMREITDEEIQHYWASGEPADKSGGYAIQGKGAMFVKQIRGSYTSVVGLPVMETANLLKAAGFCLW